MFEDKERDYQQGDVFEQHRIDDSRQFRYSGMTDDAIICLRHPGPKDGYYHRP